MITGDYKETAFAIARKIGIADSIDQCMTGSEIDSLSPEAFRRKIPHIRVFARVTPAHKVKIVRGFQEAGQIVCQDRGRGKRRPFSPGCGYWYCHGKEWYRCGEKCSGYDPYRR